MRKGILLTFLGLFLFLSATKNAYATNDPLSVPNNKVGIHIFSEKDLDNAAALVNSSGGDWGYVTVVITEGERDHDRWQQVFDRMRRLHIIPIVRIATKAEGSVWQRPKEDEIINWVVFLNSLNWVVKNRYVVIANEPNHADEWGGSVDPSGYAAYLKEFSTKLKVASDDFFVLPAGLDPSLRESQFIRGMLKAEPDIFDYVDGWTSHAYPNTGIDIYNIELKLINKSSLPVFITETGWSNKNYSEDQISQKLQDAYKNTWDADSKVVAVTPFILDYTSPPFDDYSWQKKDGTFYKFYSDIQKMPKVKGRPEQVEKGDILGALVQPIIPTGSDFVGGILARNTGQSIWDQDNIGIGSNFGNLMVKSYWMNKVEPTHLAFILFKSGGTEGQALYGGSLFLKGSQGQNITKSFPFEAAVVNMQNVHLGDIFAKISSLFN